MGDIRGDDACGTTVRAGREQPGIPRSPVGVTGANYHAAQSSDGCSAPRGGLSQVQGSTSNTVSVKAMIHVPYCA